MTAFPNFPVEFPFNLLLILGLLAIDWCLKISNLNAPIDHDSANHLYFAFLRRRKVNFFSSYILGIKFLLPRIYAVLISLIPKHRRFHFRYVNLFSSNLIILIWVLSDPQVMLYDLPIYFLGVLIMNSLWINYLTSAVEFHSSVLLMFLLFSSYSLPFEWAWPLQIICLISQHTFRFLN